MGREWGRGGICKGEWVIGGREERTGEREKEGEEWNDTSGGDGAGLTVQP